MKRHRTKEFASRALVLALAVVPVSQAAAWDVRQARDAMTDRMETSASVTSGGATEARLVVACMNGQAMPRLSFGQRIGLGDIGVTYRLDSGAVVQRMAMLSQDGRDLWPWLGDAPNVTMRMRAAKRVRVSVAGGEVYDFDLTRGDSLPQLQCWRD